MTKTLSSADYYAERRELTDFLAAKVTKQLAQIQAREQERDKALEAELAEIASLYRQNGDPAREGAQAHARRQHAAGRRKAAAASWPALLKLAGELVDAAARASDGHDSHLDAAIFLRRSNRVGRGTDDVLSDVDAAVMRGAFASQLRDASDHELELQQKIAIEDRNHILAGAIAGELSRQGKSYGTFTASLDLGERDKATEFARAAVYDAEIALDGLDDYVSAARGEPVSGMEKMARAFRGAPGGDITGASAQLRERLGNISAREPIQPEAPPNGKETLRLAISQADQHGDEAA